MKENSMFSLKNKTVLITGGNGYLGTAMSEALSKFGATLIVASRNNKKNMELKNRLSRYGNKVDCIQLDISKSTAVKKAISNILQKHGKIDVLINNAYYCEGAEFLSMKEKEWNAGIDGSINGIFHITQPVLKEMIKNKYGKIINIASMYGIVAPDVSIYEDNNYYNPINYGVGKAGIIQMSKYIASVYGKYGITCNSISPGPFPNKKVQENKLFINNLEKKVPIGRIGMPNDLKGIIVLLASDASDYINGANIRVDGGWTIW
ncbi:SDR family oxidoreductase [Clostridiaceae bacterium M8S5]|nr:SDR family oxidoreductase [Clostridiaceae bacterium M8S5]